MVGVLGCFNLLMGFIVNGIFVNLSEFVGCLFVVSLGVGMIVELLDGSGELKWVCIS